MKKGYAGFWSRFAALFIDGLIIGAVQGTVGKTSSLRGLFILASIAYFVWMVGQYGATVGKMVMHLKVVKENGSKVNYSDALLRELTSYLSLAVLGLGYLNVIWDKKKQAWHDKIAKTIVVKV